MHRLKSSWKFAALFVLGALASLLYVSHSKAFTLIESQYLPAVQLVANQGGVINVWNVSNSPLDVTLNLFADGSARTLTITLGAGKLHTFTFTNTSKTTSRFRGVLEFSAANSAISDIGTLGSNGEMVTLVPAVQLSAP